MTNVLMKSHFLRYRFVFSKLHTYRNTWEPKDHFQNGINKWINKGT